MCSNNKRLTKNNNKDVATSPVYISKLVLRVVKGDQSADIKDITTIAGDKDRELQSLCLLVIHSSCNHRQIMKSLMS
jgi:hypothetical protein